MRRTLKVIASFSVHRGWPVAPTDASGQSSFGRPASWSASLSFLSSSLQSASTPGPVSPSSPWRHFLGFARDRLDLTLDLLITRLAVRLTA